MIRLCIVLGVLLGLGMVAAGAVGGEALGEVRRWEELRGQKTIRVGDDWEIQCGWSESGEGGGRGAGRFGEPQGLQSLGFGVGSTDFLVEGA